MFSYLYSFFTPSTPSPFSNSEEIKQLLENDQWQSLLLQKESDYIVDVYLQNAVSKNPFQHKYIIKFDSEIPPNCNMTVIFPNHPVEKKRILWTNGNLRDLSLNINSRLKDSNREGCQLVVTAGNRFYRFHGFTGTIYLVWAERINQQTLNKQDNTIAESIPLLLELNGQWGYRNIFIFGKTEITNLQDAQALDPFQHSIFCCESDPRKENVRVVATMTNTQADQITKDLVVRSLISEPEPFAEELEITPDSARFARYSVSQPNVADEL